MENRRLGFLFGLLGAILLLLAALIALVGGLAEAVVGHDVFRGATAAIGGFVVDLVLALLLGFFALIGSRRSGDMRSASGVILILLALVIWLLIGGGVLLLLAGLMALIAGVLLLLARH